MSIIFTPLERVIHILSNGVNNSIYYFLDIRPISLEHVTYTNRCIYFISTTNTAVVYIYNILYIYIYMYIHIHIYIYIYIYIYTTAVIVVEIKHKHRLVSVLNAK